MDWSDTEFGYPVVAPQPAHLQQGIDLASPPVQAPSPADAFEPIGELLGFTGVVQLCEAIVALDEAQPASVLASQTRDAQADNRAQREELTRQETLIIQQQDRLLNMRLADDIDQEVFARKHTELRDRLASIKLQLDVLDRSHDETAELAAKVFELSQTLRNRWLTADYAAKRRLLEIVFLNCRLDGVTLVPTIRKPFDVLAEGLSVSSSRGDRRWTFPNDAKDSLFHRVIAYSMPFSAAMFYAS